MSLLLRERIGPHEGLWSRLDQRGRVSAMLLVGAGVGLVGGQSPTLARALVGGLGLLIFVVIAFANRDSALVMVVVWLVLLGFVRRFVIPFAGWAEQDPLLLVSPAAAVTFLLAARRSSAPLAHNALSGIAVFLMLWSGLQVFNPHEESLVVAVQGAMFYVVPLLWFFVGRSLSEAQHDRISSAVFWVAIVVIAHGLYQTFFDLLPFEYTWVGVSKQNVAIFLPGFRIRPFSTLTSPQEYGQFLAFAILIIWGRLLHPAPLTTARYRRWLLVFLGAAGVALFYQGTRTSLIFTIFALAVTSVVRFRSPVLLIAIAMGGFGVVQWVGGQSVEPTTSASAADSPERADSLARHTLSGLTDPGNSTLPMHLALIERGIRNGLRYPFGAGVSDATIAGAKSDTASAPSAENDLAVTMETLGAPAGFAYLGFIGAGFAAAFRMQRRRPSARHLAWLGILAAATTQWWNGNLYATSTILFLSLGGLSRETSALAADDEVDRSQRMRSLVGAQGSQGAT